MPRPATPVPYRLAAAVLLLTAGDASAQLFSFNAEKPLAVQSVSFGYALIDFEFDGDEEPLFSFNYDEPAYGLVYTRPNVLVTFVLGNQNAAEGRERLRLLDLSLTTWGELYLAGTGAGQTRVFFPVVFHTNYRRVTPRGRNDAGLDDFNVTVLGLGAGLGLARAFGETALFEARVNPILGLASSSFVDALGSARLLDADVQLHLGRLFGKAGLSVGYTYRSQRWNVNASNLFPDVTDELFDYRGSQHLFRLGVNW